MHTCTDVHKSILFVLGLESMIPFDCYFKILSLRVTSSIIITLPEDIWPKLTHLLTALMIWKSWWLNMVSELTFNGILCHQITFGHWFVCCRKGIRCIILERSESLRSSGVALTIMPNGWRALHQLNVASILRQTASPILGYLHAPLVLLILYFYQHICVCLWQCALLN